MTPAELTTLDAPPERALDETLPVERPTEDAPTTPCVRPSRSRPLAARAMHWIRRLHLYFGLLLFPWAVLYGVTAFLFNHPAAFSDVPTTPFGAEQAAGTALDPLPNPAELAAKVVDELNARQKPAVPYRLGNTDEARFTRDLAFASVKTGDQTVNVLVDLVNGGGTIRGTPERRPSEVEKAPFATGAAETRRPGGGPFGGGRPGGTRSPQGIQLENPLQDRLKTALPVVLERSGLPTGEVTVTSLPELRFPVEADGKSWMATYNPLTGNVAGRPADAGGEPISTRRFLTRLHTAHGYPGSVGARWGWAVIVDSMAAIMVFWGFSGLLMWWQIKSTRALGFVMLVLSAVGAAALGFGMHQVLTQ